jgi:hypothetical protein
MRPLVEELEPRILYSADAGAGLLDPNHWDGQAEVRAIDPPPAAAASASEEARSEHASTHEIVFIDQRVSDYQTLVDDLIGQNDGSRQFEIVLLDPDRDGIEQISQVLGQRHDIGAVHLISHGADGRVELGSGALDFDTLLKQATQIKGWGDAFTANGDLLIYGCDVAATPDGQAMLNALSRLTGADVAASEDLTGNAALGGDWNLEYASGRIEANIAIDQQAQQAWTGLLAISSNSTSSAMTAVAGATSLTWSHAVASGSNTALFVGISIESGGGSSTGVTYGGTAMTLVGRSAGTHVVEIWRLLAPTVGTANIVASFNGTIQVVGGAAAFDGVNQTTPTGTFVGAGGTSTTPSVAVGSAAGELVIDVLYGNDGPTATVGSGQTAQWNLATGSGNGKARGGGSTEAGAASVTMSWTLSSSLEWRIGGVSIKPAANSAPSATNLSAAEAYTEDTPLNLSDIVVSDIDSASVTATLTLSNTAAGSLNTATSGAVTSTYNAGTGVWSASGAIADVNTLLAGLTFTPAANFNSAFTIATSVSDGVAAPVTGSKAMTGTAVADTPSVTNATTNEDTQSTSGLVISRNAADGAEVTHFKITGITNGTLYKNDGTTQITNGTFITFAEGNAGLKFTPAANFNGSGSFTTQSSTSNLDAGLGGSTVNATITVNAVADTPLVTTATTNEDTQTTTGLVISRNAADGAEVTHFKITGIATGTLYKNDGSTQITNGSFISFAEGSAGLKFTPATNFNGSGSFTIQASTSNGDAGLGGSTVNATITVNPVADTLSVTNATTNEDTQTTTGLVISRNAADSAEVTHFKITGITNGALYKNDGVTAIGTGSFITFAEGNAGLRFTPTANFNGSGHFTIQASTSNLDAGLGGGTVIATITVTAVTDHILTVDTTSDTSDGDTTTVDALLANRGADGSISLREAILATNSTANGGAG